MVTKCRSLDKAPILRFNFLVNPILHGPFWAGWSRGGGGWGDGIHHTFITLVLFDGFELNLVQ